MAISSSESLSKSARSSLNIPDGNFDALFWLLLLVEECSAENGLI
jgi:hypothetical protein